MKKSERYVQSSHHSCTATHLRMSRIGGSGALGASSGLPSESCRSRFARNYVCESDRYQEIWMAPSRFGFWRAGPFTARSTSRGRATAGLSLTVIFKASAMSACANFSVERMAAGCVCWPIRALWVRRHRSPCRSASRIWPFGPSSSRRIHLASDGAWASGFRYSQPPCGCTHNLRRCRFWTRRACSSPLSGMYRPRCDSLPAFRWGRAEPIAARNECRARSWAIRMF